MSLNPARSTGANSTSQAYRPFVALLVAFAIVSAESLHHWAEASGQIFLATACLLFAYFLAQLIALPAPTSRLSDQGTSLALFALLTTIVLFQLVNRGQTSQQLALSLLFWAPLAAAWWAGQTHAEFGQLAAGLGLLAGILFWTCPPESNVQRQLLLSALLALLVAGMCRRGSPSANESTIDRRDALTGLASPEFFEAELAYLSAIANRYQIPFSLLGCRFQHSAGPFDPRPTIAQIITERLRTSDSACRWDENTFVLLLPNTHAFMASHVARNIESDLKQAILLGQAIPGFAMALVEHLDGEDPMSTLGTLESQLDAGQLLPSTAT